MTRDAVELAVARAVGRPVKVIAITDLAGDRGPNELKHAGYGQPLLVRYDAGGEERRIVLRTMGPNWFGHDRRSDRAALALLAYDTYGEIPDHVRALDVGAIGDDGAFVSLRGAGELYLLTTYADGALYAQDLRAIERRGSATDRDVARVRALAIWLARLHALPLAGPRELYDRAVRDLVGSGEGIFGIADSYPPDGPVPAARLAGIEKRVIDWRWRLRSMSHRLRRTHGDFHPYNLLFREGVEFTVLDTSRGSAGDPADDLAALAINFVFGGAVHPTSWARGMQPLWSELWSTYLDATGDRELLEVVAPFLAWRALVVASPVWYPDVAPAAREALLAFAEAALDAPAFDPASASRFIP